MTDFERKSAIARLFARFLIMTNFADRTVWTGDNLDILRGSNSASVDRIYPDTLSRFVRCGDFIQSWYDLFANRPPNQLKKGGDRQGRAY